MLGEEVMIDSTQGKDGVSNRHHGVFHIVEVPGLRYTMLLKLSCLTSATTRLLYPSYIMCGDIWKPAWCLKISLNSLHMSKPIWSYLSKYRPLLNYIKSSFYSSYLTLLVTTGLIYVAEIRDLKYEYHLLKRSSIMLLTK